MSVDESSIEQINLTNELARLMQFSEYVANAIARYSAYSQEGQRPEDAPHDLMWIAEAVSNIMRIGSIILRGDPAIIVRTCDELLTLLDKWEREPHFAKQLKPTEEGGVNTINLEDAKEIFKDIQAKVLPLVTAAQ